jgi:hypothetical protein
VDLIFLLNPQQINKNQIKVGKLNIFFSIKFYINSKDRTLLVTQKKVLKYALAN